MPSDFSMFSNPYGQPQQTPIMPWQGTPGGLNFPTPGGKDPKENSIGQPPQTPTMPWKGTPGILPSDRVMTFQDYVAAQGRNSFLNNPIQQPAFTPHAVDAPSNPRPPVFQDTMAGPPVVQPQQQPPMSVDASVSRPPVFQDTMAGPAESYVSPFDPLGEQERLAKQLLYGTSPEEEAIASRLDLQRAGLQSHFADMGATGAGALRNVMLAQAGQAGEAIAAVRAGNRQKVFDMLSRLRQEGRADEAAELQQRVFEEVTLPQAELTREQIQFNMGRLKESDQWNRFMDALTNPNLTPEEAGRITGGMGDMMGIDFKSLPRETARESMSTSILETLGWKEDDLKDPEKKKKFDAILDNWAKSELGLDKDFEPVVQVTKDYTKDPWGDDATQALLTGSDEDKRAVTVAQAEDIIATGNETRLQGKYAGDPLYDEVLKGSSGWTNSGSWTTVDENRHKFDTPPPEIGEFINYNGRIVKVTSGVQFEDDTGSKGDDYEYFTAVDPSTGTTYYIKPASSRRTGLSGITYNFVEGDLDTDLGKQS